VRINGKFLQELFALTSDLRTGMAAMGSPKTGNLSHNAQLKGTLLDQSIKVKVKQSLDSP
jgi:hypothetical protein